MLTIQEAYSAAKEANPGKVLQKCFDFGDEWGFLFGLTRGVPAFGGSGYLVISKDGKKIYDLPPTPNNYLKFQGATEVPTSEFE